MQTTLRTVGAGCIGRPRERGRGFACNTVNHSAPPSNILLPIAKCSLLSLNPTLKIKMKLKLLVALVLVTAVRGYAACSDDEGCSLNGQCLANSTCACYLPWGGDDCGQFVFLPASVQGAYGDELPPKNVTSWGGNAIYNGSAWVRAVLVRMCGLWRIALKARNIKARA